MNCDICTVLHHAPSNAGFSNRDSCREGSASFRVSRTLAKSLFWKSCFLVFVMLVGLPQASAQESQTRTWSSANGAYSVQAKLVEVTGDSVVLEKEDGQQITVEISRLSQTDQKYIRSQQPPSTPTETRTSGPMNYEGVVVLQAEREMPWTGSSVIPAPRVTLSDETVFNIEDEVSFSPFHNGMLCDPSGQMLLFATTKAGSNIAAQVFDLAKGESLGSSMINGQPLALSPDFKSLITDPALGRGGISWLYASDSRISEKLNWHFSPKSIARMEWAHFVTDRLLLTADSEGILSLWDLDARTLRWQIMSHKHCIPAVSHDQKYLVSTNGRFLFQIDIHAGRVVGCLPMIFSDPKAFAYAPSGKTIACVSWGSIKQIDATSGTMLEHFNYSGTPDARIGGWDGDDKMFVMPLRAMGVSVVDFRMKGEIRRYQIRGVSNLGTFDGSGRLWSVIRHVDEGQISYSLEANHLPHQTALQWADQQNPATSVFLKTGDSIQLDVQAIVFSASERQIEELKDIRDAIIEESFENDENPGKTGGRSSRFSPRQPRSSRGRDLSDRIAEAQRAVRIDRVDKGNRAREIIKSKLEQVGIGISASAEYTLHVEMGHPDNVTVINKPPKDAQVKVPPMTTPKPHPYTLKYHAFLTDRAGDIVWKTGSQSHTDLEGTHRWSTAKPEAVEYLLSIDIPMTFTRLRPPGYSIIKAGEIEDVPFSK